MTPFAQRFISTRYSYQLSVLLVIAFLISSCKGPGKTIPPPPEKQFGSIHFYVETSASMAGYFQQEAQFKNNISGLTAKIDKEIKPIDIWFIADSATRYAKKTQDFSSDMATTKFATGKSSQLHKIISRIANMNDSTDVSILVSDCILSFPDEEIRKNREINKTEAPNALQNGIYSTFADLKKKELATSIYAFTSKFYGVYYDYQNSQKKLTGAQRPYYIWVIANKELLAKFNTKLMDIPSFKPEKSLQFGLSEDAVTKFDIIPQLEKKGKWSKSSKELTDVTIKKNDSIQFCVTMDLSSLPAYAQTIEYLNSHLEIKSTGCTVHSKAKDKTEVDRSKLRSQPQIELVEKATHVLVFSVTAMPLNEASIHAVLPLQYDNWYEQWSCMDDRNLDTVGPKTFALRYLIDGVKDAYQTKNKNYIDITINLKN